MNRVVGVISFGVLVVALTLRYLIRDERDGLSSSTTAEQVVDRFVDENHSICNQTILVTGIRPFPLSKITILKSKLYVYIGCSLGGIGFETARVLAQSGAKVLMHFRTRVCESQENAMKMFKDAIFFL
jgi:hypothetical protein